MKRPANQLCPVCGEQGEVESFSARAFLAGCPGCLATNPLAPTGSGSSPRSAVDRWIRAAERAARGVLRGAA